MITGFNTNVRHGGRVFHVQTEDSGRDHPHVISHLYYGGTILASEKRDYAEHLEVWGRHGKLSGRNRMPIKRVKFAGSWTYFCDTQV